MDIPCSPAEEVADQNWMTVTVRGQVVEMFHSAAIINE